MSVRRESAHESTIFVVGGRPHHRRSTGGRVLIGVSDEKLDVERLSDRDLVIYDVGLDGIDATGRLRAAGVSAGILVVLPTDEVEARVAALDAGADDCVASPASSDELIARAEAVLRRQARRRGECLHALGVELDTRRGHARRGGRALELTNTEMKILELLLLNHGQVLPKAVIVERVWGETSPTLENTLEVYVGYLRRKLEAGGERRLIQTVRGVGYVLRNEPR